MVPALVLAFVYKSGIALLMLENAKTAAAYAL